MDTHQGESSLIYTRGVMPSEMTLESLYWDPANLLYEQRRHIDCPPGCAPPLALSKFSFISLQSRVDARKARSRYPSVVSFLVLSTDHSVKGPEDVLDEIMLARPEAAYWLASCLSISRMLSYLKNGGPNVRILTKPSIYDRCQGVDAPHKVERRRRFG